LVSSGQPRAMPPHPSPMHNSVQFRTTTHENYGPNPKKRGRSPRHATGTINTNNLTSLALLGGHRAPSPTARLL
jgi:hypothetical protein